MRYLAIVLMVTCVSTTPSHSTPVESCYLPEVEQAMENATVEADQVLANYITCIERQHPKRIASIYSLRSLKAGLRLDLEQSEQLIRTALKLDPENAEYSEHLKKVLNMRTILKK